MFGSTPVAHVFESSNDGSGSIWQDWQYLIANVSPFPMLESEVVL
jgi:hypothetical protein